MLLLLLKILTKYLSVHISLYWAKLPARTI